MSASIQGSFTDEKFIYLLVIFMKQACESLLLSPLLVQKPALENSCFKMANVISSLQLHLVLPACTLL